MGVGEEDGGEGSPLPGRKLQPLRSITGEKTFDITGQPFSNVTQGMSSAPGKDLGLHQKSGRRWFKNKGIESRQTYQVRC